MAANLGAFSREYLAAVFAPLELPLVPMTTQVPKVLPCYMVHVDLESAEGTDQSGAVVKEISVFFTLRIWCRVAVDVNQEGLLHDEMDRVAEEARGCVELHDEGGVQEGDWYRAEVESISWGRVWRAPDKEKGRGSVTVEGLLNLNYTLE